MDYDEIKVRLTQEEINRLLLSKIRALEEELRMIQLEREADAIERQKEIKSVIDRVYDNDCCECEGDGGDDYLD